MDGRKKKLNYTKKWKAARRSFKNISAEAIKESQIYESSDSESEHYHKAVESCAKSKGTISGPS